MFQGVGRWILGRLRAQRSWEFWEGVMLGSVVENGSVEAISGVDWLWNGGVVMLGFWVRLGEELGVDWRAVKALVWMKMKEEEGARFQWKKEGVLGGSELWIALSLSDDKKALKEEEAVGFISYWRSGCALDFKKSTGGRELLQQGRWEATGINCPPEDLLRDERG